MATIADGPAPATGGTGTPAGAAHAGGNVGNMGVASGDTTSDFPASVSTGGEGSAMVGDMQSASEDTQLGKVTGQLSMTSVTEMATFSRQDRSEPTTMMAALRIRNSGIVSCDTKPSPTTVGVEARRAPKRKEGMPNPLAPVSAEHLAGLGSVGQDKLVDRLPDWGAQYLGSFTMLPGAEKQEGTNEYAEEALKQLVVAGEGARASRGGFLKIRREHSPGIQAPR